MWWPRRQLAAQWAALLQDWAVLGSSSSSTQSASLVLSYKPAFLPASALSVLPRVAAPLEAAAPAAMLALAASIACRASGTEQVRPACGLITVLGGLSAAFYSRQSKAGTDCSADEGWMMLAKCGCMIQ